MYENMFSGNSLSSSVNSIANTSPPKDLNRTDDNDAYKLDVERNRLLEDILKTLRGEDSISSFSSK